MQTLEAQQAHYKEVRARIANAPVKLRPTAVILPFTPPPPPPPPRAPEPEETPRRNIPWRGGVSQRCKRVIIETAERYGVHPADILGRSRKVEFTAPRQEAMYLLHKLGLSTPVIGYIMDRDHSTAMHAIRKWTAKLGGDNGPDIT